MVTRSSDKVRARAQLLLDEGQLDEALETYALLSEFTPEDIQNLLKIADLQVRLGDHAEAIDTFSQVAALYYSQSGYLRAVAIYKRILSLDSSRLDYHRTLAKLYVKLNLLAEALTHFRHLVTVYEQKGDLPHAADMLEEMLTIDPVHLAARIKLAEVYLQLNHKHKARSHFEEAARTLKHTGRIDAYVKVAERITFLFPADIRTIKTLAQYCLEQGKVRPALAKLQKCLRIDREDTEVLEMLAKAFSALGQIDKSVSLYRELARLYKQMGRDHAVKRVAQNIWDHLPQDPQALDLLGLSPVVAAPEPPAALKEPAVPVFCAPLGSTTPAATPAFAPAPIVIPIRAPPFEPIATVVSPFEAIFADVSPFEAISAVVSPFEAIFADVSPFEAISADVPPFEAIPADVPPFEAIPTSAATLPSILDASSVASPAVTLPTQYSYDGELDVEPSVFPDGVQDQHPESKTSSAQETLLKQPTTWPLGHAHLDSRPSPSRDRREAILSKKIYRLLDDSDIYLKYGLAHKALQKVDRALELDSRNLSALSRRKDIYLQENELSSGVETLLEMVRVARQKKDQEVLDDATAELQLLNERHADIENLSKDVFPQGLPKVAAFDTSEPMPAEGGDDFVDIDIDNMPVSDAQRTPASKASSLESERGQRPALESPTSIAPMSLKSSLPRPVTMPLALLSEKDLLPADDIDDADLKLTVTQPKPHSDSQQMRGSSPVVQSRQGVTAHRSKLEALYKEIEKLKQEAGFGEDDDTPAEQSSQVLPWQDAAEEIDFFLVQGLLADARELLLPLLEEFPGQPELENLRDRVQDEDDEDSLLDLWELERSLSTEVTREDEGGQIPFEDVFAAFKKGVEREVSESDYQTHYDLAIAYREMGLWDDAIRELELIQKSSEFEVRAMCMIGEIWFERADYTQALLAYRNALGSPSLSESAALALMYDVGQVYLKVGKLFEATAYFRKVEAIDASFRDVSNQLEALGQDDQLDDLLQEYDEGEDKKISYI
jgi:pilus assembly protein FimV